MKPNGTKSIADIRKEFRDKGVTQSEWCRVNGFSLNAMREVMNGRSKFEYGEAHQIAVALGLKQGTIVPAEEFHPVERKLARAPRKPRKSIKTAA